VQDVLIFAPCLLERLEPKAIQSLMALEWDGPLSLLLARGTPINTHEGHVQDHLRECRRGRKMFLDGSYEAMLIVETDIVHPKDTLKRLVALDCDVAYGCMMYRRSTVPAINVLERYPGNSPNIGESLSLHGLWPAAVRQGIVECSGGSLGCTLIRRHVLEAIDFRVEDAIWCDTFWTRDVYAAGFSMKADTGVVCGHIDEDGIMLHPEGSCMNWIEKFD
jgi:hypothetical protein